MPVTKWGCDQQTCVTHESCPALRGDTSIGLGFREEYKHEPSTRATRWGSAIATIRRRFANRPCVSFVPWRPLIALSTLEHITLCPLHLCRRCSTFFDQASRSSILPASTMSLQLSSHYSSQVSSSFQICKRGQCRVRDVAGLGAEGVTRASHKSRDYGPQRG
jgi:hypothetical protein